ncbi:MAG: HDIG domain-containing protein [Armatimonadia bacterium]|nr:HDIG domain-containing protein [Armatimonadia bacterium]
MARVAVDPAGALQRAWLADAMRAEVTALGIERGYELYLVGGAVRDVLLAREVGDWDLAGHGVIDIARHFGADHDLRAVVLHEELPTVRVILRPGDPTGFLDFVELRAPEIEQDLERRDFTINALAWDIRGADELVDPTGGLDDLRSCTIRSPRREALESDPLRVLRAFRFAAQLNFDVETDTGEWLGELAPRLEEVAGERIGQEIVKLFAAPHCADAMQAAENLGALDGLVPPLGAMRGVQQGGYHHLDVLGHTLLALHEAERAINDPELFFPRAADAVRVWLDDPTNRAAVRLGALFHDVGKPECRTEEDGRTRFLGHADESAATFLDLARQWCLPTHLRRKVVRMIRLHMRPLELSSSGMRAESQGRKLRSVITLKAIRRLMRDAGPAGIGLFLLAAGDRSACRGPASQMEQRGRIYEVFDDMLVRYLNWLREHRARPRLIDGETLMGELGLPEGPLVGELLDAIAEAYDDREIDSEAEALALAREMLADMDE